MKILLVIGYVWPEPNSSAAGSRMLQLIKSFQRMGYEVHYGSAAQPSEHAIDFTDYGISAHEIQVNDSRFDAFCQALSPDVVLFDRFMMEEQFSWRVEKTCPQAVRLLDTEDLHCLRFTRQRLAKGHYDVVKPVTLAELMQDERCIRELAAIYRCDCSLMISAFEITLLRDLLSVPESLLHYSPFMLTSRMQTVENRPFVERQHFISIGNFRHEPNWDAVLQLKQHIWPQIRKALPNAELHIYGAYPPKKATQLHNAKDGFLVKGWCEHAKTVVTNARVLLAPLRFGAGLKGKIIEAAQCGTPVVTTSIGAEGMAALQQEQGHGLICDNVGDFAHAAISLYQDPEKWQALHNHAHNSVQEFDWHTHHDRLSAHIENLSRTISEHRLQNITGAILRHQSMKSTQYMSQWIEAKNQLAAKQNH